METKMKDCPDCEGEGEKYEDTSRECTSPRSECCGGCGHYYDCETCNGTGEVEDEDKTEENK
jgi:DnaJ-class molecular chaperone